VRKCAHGKECPWECGKFGYRAGKSPPNTNNVNLFFSTSKHNKEKRQTEKQNQQQQVKTK